MWLELWTESWEITLGHLTDLCGISILKAPLSKT